MYYSLIKDIDDISNGQHGVGTDIKHLEEAVGVMIIIIENFILLIIIFDTWRCTREVIKLRLFTLTVLLCACLL